MSAVEVYSTRTCPYCVRAKDLLTRKNIPFTEIVMESDEDRMALMKRADGRRTVPQIFINGVGIGGYDDLYALDSAGKLDAMLNTATER